MLPAHAQGNAVQSARLVLDLLKAIAASGPIKQIEGISMSRRPARFTQGDVARAIRAAKAAGASSLQIKPDGTIIVNLLKPTAGQDANEAVEPEEHFVL
jgi:hypothetical protein